MAEGVNDADPTAALTVEDRQWLLEHGWRPAGYPTIGTVRVWE